ncbi:major capsid protein [Paraburkholderia adhaesiva]|uniref:major capsid protein n=1 Tax=Paraburkholderia adhaesiva TaxID=2883244 RepID=UPI001F17F87D|nr:major capsid protein [Paraburkholderia adhaesiva]
MNIYDTNALILVVPNLLRPQKFLLDRFFPNIVTSDTEEVSIDVDVGKRRMSPFVSPLLEGRLVEQRRYQTNKFRPAYLKDKRAPDLRKPIRRMIGERIGGELRGEERAAANIAAEMTDQIDLLDRRLEWMAAQALMTGTVLIEGDGFPAALVDFGRDPELTLALSGSSAWDNPNGTPTHDIEVWQRLILKKSGAQVTDLIFTTTPFEYFIADERVKAAVYYPKLSDFGNAIDPGAQIAKGAVYKGRWGQYSLWVYNDWYVDDNDVEQPMIPDGVVIMAGSDLMGTRAFGMILDPRFNYAALPYAPKMWIAEDPPQRFLMMQSAPIVIPSRVNAALCATVCAPQES